MNLHSWVYLPQLGFGYQRCILVRQGELRCVVVEVVGEVLLVVGGGKVVEEIVGAIPPVWGLPTVFLRVHHEGFAPFTVLRSPLVEEGALMPCVMAMAHRTPDVFSLGVC